MIFKVHVEKHLNLIPCKGKLVKGFVLRAEKQQQQNNIFEIPEKRDSKRYCDKNRRNKEASHKRKGTKATNADIVTWTM